MSRQPAIRRLALATAALLGLLVCGQQRSWAGAFEKIPKHSRLKRLYRPSAEFPGPATCRGVRRSYVVYPSQQEYCELRDFGVRFIKKYLKSDRDVVVGLGRSAAVVTALMQNLGIRALTFPDGAICSPDRPDDARQAYKRHFNRILGPSVLKGKHRILLIDRVESGGSLRSVKLALRYHLKRKKSSVKVVTVGFTEYAENVDWGDHTIGLGDDNHLTELNYGDYDAAVGRFRGKHRVRADSYQSLQLNQGYDQMREAVRKAMKTDKKLDGWLAQSAPAFLRKPATKSPGSKKKTKHKKGTK